MSTSPIILEPYSPAWPLLFEEEKTSLLQVIGAWVVEIEHIGSTAIAGLSAKPVIDILIGVRSLSDADEHCIEKIKALGYTYRQEFEKQIPERRFFQKSRRDASRIAHIHLVEFGSEIWKRHLLFRDYLRSHPDVSAQYEALKRALASQFSDTNEYANAKTPFISQTLAAAQKEVLEKSKSR